MKVFISMGMKGKTDEEIATQMQVYRQLILDVAEQPDTVEFIDSIISGASKNISVKGDHTALWYLGQSLSLMAEADLVFFAQNHSEYRGCALERKCAEAYNVDFVDENDMWYLKSIQGVLSNPTK